MAKTAPVQAIAVPPFRVCNVECTMQVRAVDDHFCPAGEGPYIPSSGTCDCNKIYCAPICSSDADCPTGQTCFVDTATDRGHCSGYYLPGSSSSSSSSAPYAWQRCLGNFTTCDEFCGSQGKTCSNSCAGFGGCVGTNMGYNQAEAWPMNGSKCWNQGACNKKIESPDPSYNVTWPHLCHEYFNAFCCCGARASSSSSTCQKSSGDANCDGKVDEADYIIWKGEYLGQVTTSMANFNGDDKVNLFDFEIWRSHTYQ